MSVGNETQYRTNCTLQPGRQYIFQIQSNVSLTEPDEIIYEYSSNEIRIVMSKYFYYQRGQMFIFF